MWVDSAWAGLFDRSGQISLLKAVFTRSPIHSISNFFLKASDGFQLSFCLRTRHGKLSFAARSLDGSHLGACRRSCSASRRSESPRQIDTGGSKLSRWDLPMQGNNNVLANQPAVETTVCLTHQKVLPTERDQIVLDSDLSTVLGRSTNLKILGQPKPMMIFEWRQYTFSLPFYNHRLRSLDSTGGVLHLEVTVHWEETRFFFTQGHLSKSCQGKKP